MSSSEISQDLRNLARLELDAMHGPNRSPETWENHGTFEPSPDEAMARMREHFHRDYVQKFKKEWGDHPQPLQILHMTPDAWEVLKSDTIAAGLRRIYP